MNVEEELRSRIAKVVKKMVRPPVLFGQKWLRPCPDGPPGRWQFIGALKVAKATGIDRQRVAKKIVERVKLWDLKLKATITSTGVITLSPTKKAGKKKPPAKKKAAADKAKKPPAKKKAAADKAKKPAAKKKAVPAKAASAKKTSATSKS